jgi:hypothetical protein
MVDENPRIYTVPLDFLYELIEGSEEQVSTTKSLLHDFLNGLPDNKNLLSIVVEILWANNSILKLVNDEIETAVLTENEKTGEQEFLLVEAAMITLQNLVLARHYSVTDLCRLSYSVNLH